MPAEATSTTRGYLAALVSAVFLSTTAIFIRHLVDTYAMPPLLLALWRAVFVTLTLIAVLGLAAARLLRIRRGDLRGLIVYGLVLALFNSLWTLSVAHNGAAVATVLVYSSAAFTALLGWRLLGEPLDGPKLLAVALSIIGCTLIAGALRLSAWQTNLAGILTGILSGLSYAVYSLLGRSSSQRGLNPWTTLLYTFGFGSVFLLGFNLLPGDILPGTAPTPGDLFWLGDALGGWGILLLLAAVPTVGGYGLYNVSLSYLASSVANLIMTTEPAFTAVIAYATLGERLSPIEIMGAVLIMAGVVLLRATARRRLQRLNGAPIPGPAGD